MFYSTLYQSQLKFLKLINFKFKTSQLYRKSKNTYKNLIKNPNEIRLTGERNSNKTHIKN